MGDKINPILKEVIGNIKPSKEELENIHKSVDNILNLIHDRIHKSKIDVDVFIGGSFAKGTLIKKDKYDVDTFLRFNEKYKKENISEITQNLLEGMKNVIRVHGSRDYFRVKLENNLYIELIPVIAVKNPKEAENITDLSYSHVRYVKQKIKSPKMAEDIMLAKAFCYAARCYGAESYVNGFSGYGLELLIYNYKNFIDFIREIAKYKSDKKIIIDLEKKFKNKQRIMLDLNNSKLYSPIILIDPTFQQRNVLAALSQQTFEKFQKYCRDFLKKPSAEFFELKKIDFGKAREHAEKNKFDFILLRAKTNKQEGDIAGSKLLKFSNHINEELLKYFNVRQKGFDYDGKKSADYYFTAKSRKEMLIQGPFAQDGENCKAFKKAHHKAFIKKGRLYSKEILKFNLKEFLNEWTKKNQDKIKDMGIISLEIIG